MAQVLIVGANRGIGLELAKQHAARGDAVLATCRTPSPGLTALESEGVTLERDVDVTTAPGRARLVEAVGTRGLDVVWLVAGVLRDDALGELDADSIRGQLEVNAVAPLLCASLLSPRIVRGGKLALLTSRMGSIADNGSGGYYGYRMSKAALNAAGKSLAIDLAPRGIHVGILHPGFVRTAMTGNNGLIDADESARLLLARLDALDASTSGRFFHADGTELPW